MSYDGNKLTKLNVVPMDGSFGMWAYKTADNFTTVKAANFLSDAYARGVRKGDLIIVIEDATTPVMTMALILTSTAAGACTMTQTGLVP